jgi:hypothetical protein
MDSSAHVSEAETSRRRFQGVIHGLSPFLATASIRTIDAQSAASDVSSVLEYSRQRCWICGADIGIAFPPPAMQKAPPTRPEFISQRHPLHF